MSVPAEQRTVEGGLTAADLREAWPVLSASERLEGLSLLTHAEAESLFLSLKSREQADIAIEAPPPARRSWMRMLPPDDAADVIQLAPEDDRDDLLALLDPPTRKEVVALLAYAEDDAGGLMNPRYGRLRPEMSVDEAVSYLRRQTRERLETVYYVYVLDAEQHLMGVVSFRDLLTAPPDKRVREIMRTEVVTVPAEMDQETLSGLFAQHDFLAMPVVDAEGRMQGIVTVDDIVDVVQEEATEDIQKLGGMEALDAPYLDVSFWTMVRKRGGWLALLFIGEMLTASAMAHYEDEIARAVVLALFIPLIISSGGNSGSQASTLVVRAMALGELTLRDWWRVVRRELASGLTLGCLLAVIGFIRIVLWQSAFHVYGEHYLLIAVTVSASLVGIVTLGSLAGSMLPLVFQQLGFDPASASAPFVATLIDVAGLVLYFTLASLILSGTLL
ncbi:MAG TPA: magnesium transporter [Candidatus Binatia bacterium]|jgi:magnesium transporter|nr:magnesium transporter [Candidatus Binatia bacterium]